MPARRPALRILACGTVLAASLYGCSLDFWVRPDPGDAGITTEGGADGSTGDGGGPDADGSTTDGPLPDAAACADLAKEIPPKKTKARECTFQVGECQAMVMDECGCQVVVSFLDAGRTADYEAAIKNFLGAGCKAACGGNCKSVANKNCLQQ